MPRIEIETPPSDGSDRYAMGYCTIVRLDGTEVKHVVSLDLSFNVDEAVTATMRLLASDGFKFVNDVKAVVSIVVPEGYRLKATTMDDGTTAYESEGPTMKALR